MPIESKIQRKCIFPNYLSDSIDLKRSDYSFTCFIADFKSSVLDFSSWSFSSSSISKSSYSLALGKSFSKTPSLSSSYLSSSFSTAGLYSATEEF